jgi:hypothetical protein
MRDITASICKYLRELRWPRAPPARRYGRHESGDLHGSTRAGSKPRHRERADEGQHGAGCDVDRGRSQHARSLDHGGGSERREPSQDGNTEIVRELGRARAAARARA